MSLSSVAETKSRPAPRGELVLDMNTPIIEVKIGRQTFRLRVALEQKRLIELNPAAADRLRADPPSQKFSFEPGGDAQVGRELLKGVQATVPVTINRQKMLVTAASHERDCCVGVDGEIGVTLLPYATIRFVRPGRPGPTATTRFAISDDDEHGPQTALTYRNQSIFVQFSLDRPDTIATYSAGVILARVYGGKLAGNGEERLAAFGVKRPTRMLQFSRAASVAGFAFESLPVRTADFAGQFDFAPDPAEANDIVVSRKIKQQAAWPVVLIGRDKLDRCSEAAYDTLARELTLRCDFGAAP